MKLTPRQELDLEYQNDQLLIARQIAEYEDDQEYEARRNWRNMYMLNDARNHEISMYVFEDCE